MKVSVAMCLYYTARINVLASVANHPVTQSVNFYSHIKNVLSFIFTLCWSHFPIFFDDVYYTMRLALIVIQIRKPQWKFAGTLIL